VAEVTACGLPSILVPYPYATARHQEANARAVQRAGGASILFDDRLTPEELAERIQSLIDHEERLRAMSERARGWSRPDAAERMAELVAEAAAPAGRPVGRDRPPDHKAPEGPPVDPDAVRHVAPPEVAS
jgi:UDP-N-acetylglucosamine--N-acetylmuramyl-(pentapeptide) pyrophosphoryl-undecaprenol N-acetylglucosamine transferase